MSTRSDNPNQTDIPRTHTIKPMDPPPMTEGSTTAQLKGDINSGRTGDKNEVFDPGLATLGTDEEAAGTPVTPARAKLARMQETKRRWLWGGRKTSAAHDKDDRGALYAFVGLIVAIGVVMLGGIVWLT